MKFVYFCFLLPFLFTRTCKYSVSFIKFVYYYWNTLYAIYYRRVNLLDLYTKYKLNHFILPLIFLGKVIAFQFSSSSIAHYSFKYFNYVKVGLKLFFAAIFRTMQFSTSCNECQKISRCLK